MNRPLVVIGATGVGKTQWLLKHFCNRNCVVVNVDSIQIYKYFNIGSAKISPTERSLLPHVMVDERDPLDSVSVTEYAREAIQHIQNLKQQGKRVIVCAGTPYYLKSILWGSPSVPAIDPAIRTKVAGWIGEKGGLYAYQALCELDPKATAKFHSGDIYRTSRAWEVYYQTGKILSSFTEKQGGLQGAFDIIGLERPRPIMWERLQERVNIMLSQGLKQEVYILRRHYAKTLAMQSIGYKEWFEAERHGWSESGIAQAIYFHTRQYVKRQMTFFRSFERVNWFDLTCPGRLDSHLELLLS